MSQVDRWQGVGSNELVALGTLPQLMHGMQAERASNRGFCSPGVLQFAKRGRGAKLSEAVSLVALRYFYASDCI
jgi:hypothetical protein